MNYIINIKRPEESRHAVSGKQCQLVLVIGPEKGLMSRMMMFNTKQK